MALGPQRPCVHWQRALSERGLQRLDHIQPCAHWQQGPARTTSTESCAEGPSGTASSEDGTGSTAPRPVLVSPFTLGLASQGLWRVDDRDLARIGSQAPRGATSNGSGSKSTASAEDSASSAVSGPSSGSSASTAEEGRGPHVSLAARLKQRDPDRRFQLGERVPYVLLDNNSRLQVRRPSTLHSAPLPAAKGARPTAPKTHPRLTQHPRLTLGSFLSLKGCLFSGRSLWWSIRVPTGRHGRGPSRGPPEGPCPKPAGVPRKQTQEATGIGMPHSSPVSWIHVSRCSFQRTRRRLLKGPLRGSTSLGN